MQTITPEALHEKMKAGDKLTILDVRSLNEFAEAHIKGSKLLPLDALEPELVHDILNESGLTPDTLYVTCASGRRSAMACQKLMEADFSGVTMLEGGVIAWELAGLPIGRGEPKVEEKEAL